MSLPSKLTRLACFRVLQGWMFVNEILFWTQDRVKAFLTAVPQVNIAE
jgi:Alpha-N-acetylglucosaminidase (NAGLU).